MQQCSRCHSFALNIAPKSGLCDVCYYKYPLLNLLAILHRDGGHYTEKHGVDKSVKVAMKKASNLVVK